MSFKRVLLSWQLAACVVLLSGCDEDKQQEMRPRISVKVTDVSSRMNQMTKSYVGTVNSSVESQLSFQVAGNIKKVLVTQGQIVRKGQLLAVLEDGNLYHSNLSAQATLKQAEDGYNRLKVLYDNGSLPEIKFIEIQTKLEQARAMAQITEKNLKDAKLYAPFDGVITGRDVENGETVTPALPVLTLSKLSPLYIKIAVPESEIARLVVGDQCFVSVAAAKNNWLAGTISEINPIANKFTHTYEVRLRFDNEPEGVMPGMIGNVSLGENLGGMARSIVFPARVIRINSDGSRFVWCVENNVAKRKLVVLGKLCSEGIEIVSGLDENDVVITDGAHKVYENAPLKVM